MAAPHKKARLNLNILYPQGLPEKIYLKFLKWLLNYGKFILIAVEVVVIGAFLARFTLDAQEAELTQKIDNQIPYIQSLKDDEVLIRRTQFKLTEVKKAFDTNPDWKNILNQLSQQIPLGITLQSLNLDQSGSDPSEKTEGLSFRITGQSLSNNDLAVLLGGLKKDSNFKNISLTNISFDQGVIIFTIVGEVISK